MKRTQIYLSEQELMMLSGASATKKKSVSELIRQVIDKTYLQTEKTDFSKALNQICGMWKDREEIKDTGAYVKKLREDRRSVVAR